MLKVMQPSYSLCMHVLLLLHFRCGPLVHLWCMRFEGKHNYFKDLAHRIKCFKNVLKTMSEHYQYTVCYEMNSMKAFEKYVITGPCK